MEVVALSRKHVPDLATEWAAHHANLCRRDPRLATPPRQFFADAISHAIESAGLAFGVRDAMGWRVLATGTHYLLREEEPAQEIIFRNNVTWCIQLLRSWDGLDAPSLMDALHRVAHDLKIEMMYASVPSVDAESIALLARNGFDPAYCHCVLAATFPEPPSPPAGVSLHIAYTGEGQKVIDGHMEELDYHAMCAPSQRTDYTGRYERQLAGCEDVIADPDGISMYASVGGEVVAVADGRVGPSFQRPSHLLPEATIGFIRSVGTRSDWQRRGVGKSLSLALAYHLQNMGARRLELVYCPWNPLSSRFWPSLGFQPAVHGFCMRPNKGIPEETGDPR